MNHSQSVFLFCVTLSSLCLVVSVIMVMFPSSLTEEEEALQKKFAKLKKKVCTAMLCSLSNTIVVSVLPTNGKKHAGVVGSI